MASVNSCHIVGNLGADPEMKYTPNGNAVTTFSVACNESWTDAQGEKREEVEWFSVVAWNRLAETCAEYLSKGRQVYIEGRMKTRSWEKDGVKHYKTELIARNVRFLGSAEGGGGGGNRDYAGAERYDAPAATPVAAGDIDPDDLPF